ncbi:MAG: methylenetetrahydrofolate--tRNA-(uracil(54)-C(5))-methyltransferase (FADH(2)-oxidizing) TrmFO [Cyanobacteria bacterium]|nr:methylenetetrahydrofolate--tRNA-(uracil(54)-C(5))-methyltransferase (FADH(2)-oxidizing) TrmFO [Cyanobacteriota bacterium]
MKRIHIIGAGLAGSEAALYLANRDIPVTLFDMKPEKPSKAHHQSSYAEIVCSNSLGSQLLSSASGLLKQELRMLGSSLLSIAEAVAVPAGQALAVDRERFSEAVTQALTEHPLIELVCKDVQELSPEAALSIIATGPMTSVGLSGHLSTMLQRSQLYFFDAASPIITRDSIDFSIAFSQNRYALEKAAQNDTAPDESYINCPLDASQYERLVNFLCNAEAIPLKDFEKEEAQYFESCLPVEVIASRGPETLRFGPMKPVGLINPHTQKRPHAVVQLRQDNREGTLFNMVGFQTNLRWGEQKSMIQSIPGLENADIVRYGVMHRNTYLHSPDVLLPTLQLQAFPNVLIAGQLTGTEGYTESIATGLIAAINAKRLFQGEAPLMMPAETMIGALTRYITREEARGQSFQPINSNWGILPALAPEPSATKQRIKDKKSRNQVRNQAFSARSKSELEAFSARHLGTAPQKPEYAETHS